MGPVAVTNEPEAGQSAPKPTAAGNGSADRIDRSGETLQRGRPIVTILLILLLCLSAIRVVSTYRVFSATNDEPAHIGCGMEWLDLGRYEYDYQHPPLARVAAALGPYLSGIRSFGKRYMWEEGKEILHAGGSYDRTLFLARLGILPFLLVAGICVYAMTRPLLGEPAALAGAGLFLTLPPVLAHGGLATTDMALAATLPLAIHRFDLWVDRPDGIRSAAFGSATGIAILSKFSAIPFLAACLPAIALARWRCRKPRGGGSRARHPWKSAGVVLAVLIFTVWAGYRFSIGPVSDAALRPHETVDRILGSRGKLHDLAYSALEASIYPMPEFFRGINHLRGHNEIGHRGQFLLGEVRENSWWYFFFVAIGVKTPIPFLLLAGLGFWTLHRRRSGEKDWHVLVPGLCAAAIFLVCVPSRIKLGVRHILPIYPFLAVAAASGFAFLWSAFPSRPAGRAAAAVLLLWQVASGAVAHPDYIPYFNLLSGSHPERILSDSDLDWGQDLKRMVERFRSLGVERASVAVATSADLDRFAPPVMTVLPPNERRNGWIAVSLYRLQYDFSRRPPYRGYAWLESYDPVATAGKSIRIYHVPADPVPGMEGPRGGAATEGSTGMNRPFQESPPR